MNKTYSLLAASQHPILLIFIVFSLPYLVLPIIIGVCRPGVFHEILSSPLALHLYLAARPSTSPLPLSTSLELSVPLPATNNQLYYPCCHRVRAYTVFH